MLGLNFFRKVMAILKKMWIFSCEPLNEFVENKSLDWVACKEGGFEFLGQWIIWDEMN